LPDAIISATALTYNMVLMTNDKELFKLKDIEIKVLIE